MSSPASPDEAFEFYEGLQADNSKAYWTDHKATWETCVRDPMNALVDELQPVIGGDVKVFRPYRDVRFAADKSPYKTNQGAMINDANGESGLYVHIDADGLLVATGYYQTASDQGRAVPCRRSSTTRPDLGWWTSSTACAVMAT